MDAEPSNIEPPTVEAPDVARVAQLAASSLDAGARLVEPLEWFVYAKSAPVYTSVVRTAAGELVDVVVKDVSRTSLIGSAAQVKPSELHDPSREAAVYRHVLAGVDGPPVLWGARSDGDVSVVVLERVAGLELRDVGDLDVWAATAAWFGSFAAAHAGPSPQAVLGPAAAAVPLLGVDATSRRAWRDRAVGVLDRFDEPVAAAVRGAVDVYDAVAGELLAASPHGVVHGEAYPSNVVVAGPDLDVPLDVPGHLSARTPPAGLRVAVLDWETAGFAPVLVDLAALTTGDWDRDARSRVVGAYVTAAAAGGLVFEDLAAQLAACRLGLALQWLAWFALHAPPAHQARDWAGEAVAAAAELT